MGARFTMADLQRGTATIVSITAVSKLSQLQCPRRRRSTRSLGVGAAKASKKRVGPTPHDILWDAVRDRWPSAHREFKSPVPGRRFRLDIAFAEERVAIEVDGFQHHGRFKADFQADRRRQNLLVQHGWKPLRYPAGQIRTDLAFVMADIEFTLAQIAATHEHARRLPAGS